MQSIDSIILEGMLQSLKNSRSEKHAEHFIFILFCVFPYFSSSISIVIHFIFGDLSPWNFVCKIRKEQVTTVYLL